MLRTSDPEPLEVGQVRWDDGEAVRAGNNTTAARERGREVDTRANQPHSPERVDTLAAGGTPNGCFERVFRIDLIIALLGLLLPRHFRRVRLAKYLGIGHPTHNLEHLLWCDRLGDIVDRAGTAALLHAVRVVERRGHHDRYMGPVAVYTLSKPEAITTRHADIAEHDGCGFGHHQLQRLGCTVRLLDGVPLSFQAASHEGAHNRLVVHDENVRPRRRLCVSRSIHCLVGVKRTS